MLPAAASLAFPPRRRHRAWPCSSSRAATCPTSRCGAPSWSQPLQLCSVERPAASGTASPAAPAAPTGASCFLCTRTRRPATSTPKAACLLAARCSTVWQWSGAITAWCAAGRSLGAADQVTGLWAFSCAGSARRARRPHPRPRRPRLLPPQVDAERALLRAALADPRARRFVLLSESCVPLYPAPLVWGQLLAEGRSRINACRCAGWVPAAGGAAGRWRCACGPGCRQAEGRVPPIGSLALLPSTCRPPAGTTATLWTPSGAAPTPT